MMIKNRTYIYVLPLLAFLVLLIFLMGIPYIRKEHTGVGVEAPKTAQVLFDGSREMLDEKWTYWEGPRFSSELPLKWEIVKDPVDEGTVVSSNDPYALDGKY